MVREQNMKGRGCGERDKRKKKGGHEEKRVLRERKERRGKWSGGLHCDQEPQDSGLGKWCAQIQIQVLLGICHRCMTLN